jgi:hypothetical protein
MDAIPAAATGKILKHKSWDAAAATKRIITEAREAVS